MRIIPIVLAALVVSVGVAFAANGAAPTGDQGRRLSGPFCVGKPNAGANAGVVRSIAKTQTCRSYEIRKAGVAVPCASVTVNLVPTDPCLVVVSKPGAPGASGPQGGQGAKGDTGAAGVAGKDGKNGENGVQGDTGAPGKDAECLKKDDDEDDDRAPQSYNPSHNDEGNSCKGEQGDRGPKGDTGAQGPAGPKGDKGNTGDKGATGNTGPAGPAGAASTVPGPAGATGPAGAPGPQGAAGPQGPAGANGTNGLGDGTRWICKEGEGQGSLKDGGIGTLVKPTCNKGTDFAYKVVTSGSLYTGPFGS